VDTNWCYASGVSYGPVGNPFRQTGGDSLCSLNAYQSHTNPVSWCADIGYDTPATLDDDKGNLLPDGPVPVRWRLPSHGDFLIAVANGAGAVLRNFGASSYWTATVESADRHRSIKFGGGYEHQIFDVTRVRCIGR
jgi:hypothetical protein